MTQVGDTVILIAEPTELQKMGIHQDYHHITGWEFKVITISDRFKGVGIRNEDISTLSIMVLNKFIKKKYK